MLTGDLVRVRVQGSELRPSFVEPKPALREAANALVSAFREAVAEGRTRGELQEEVDDLCAERRDHKVLRGLAKLCFDHGTFDVEAPVSPAILREKAFRRAAEVGPLALEPGPLGRPVADDILTELAREHGLTLEQVRTGLYADLKQAQRIQAFDWDSPEDLLHRYNVSLVQALLLRAVEVRVSLKDPPAARMRQLFRYVKLFQLIHTATREGSVLRLRLDGPTSLFSQSTRYGMQLANFFPALLHLDTPWQLEATVLWTKARHRKRLVLDHTAGLVGHYVDRGGYRTREQEWFAERFQALESGWALSEGEEPLSLADRAVIFPDFTFRQGRRVAHLEILGFWRHDDLARKLALLAEYGPGNLVLAVSRRLRGSKEALSGELPVPVVDFAEVVPARQVLAAVEQVAREPLR